MLRFVLVRLLRVFGITIGAASLGFLLLRLVPGDPLNAAWGRPLDPERAAILAGRLELRSDPLEAFGHYLGDLARGDLGRSLSTREPVLEALASRAAPTALLVATSLFLAMVLGLVLGAVAGARPGGLVDRAMPLGCSLLLAAPSFLIAMLLLLVFGAWLGWAPISGYRPGELRYLVLPAAALALRPVALLARAARDEVRVSLTQLPALAARARGGGGWRWILDHGLRPVAVPLLELGGAVFASILAGTYFVEYVFAWPGLGQWTLRAVERLDIFALNGAVMLTALVGSAAHAGLELIAAALDVRRRGA
jgi:peptide/nickel transport system permease protein